MCCCGKPVINGQEGYSWDGKTFSVRKPFFPELEDGDELIKDLPGRSKRCRRPKMKLHKTVLILILAAFVLGVSVGYYAGAVKAQGIVKEGRMNTREIRTRSGYPHTIYGDMPTREAIEKAIARLSSPDFKFRYSYWRHGGSYTNVTYPGGACGCIASARHTISGKFEIACDNRFDGRPTFRTREEAAKAEKEIALELWRVVAEEIQA
jgi:hypothetical protein